MGFFERKRNPAAGSEDKRVYWPFRMPGGRLFTDAAVSVPSYSFEAVPLCLALASSRRTTLAPASLRNLFRALKHFVTYLVSYPHPILRFKDVLPHHCEDYIEKLLSSDATNSWKYNHIHILQKLFQYRGVMKDGLVIDPLQGESAAKIVGSRNAAFVWEQNRDHSRRDPRAAGAGVAPVCGAICRLSAGRVR